MFRQMRRNRQQLSRERCEEILSRATSGVLAVPVSHKHLRAHETGRNLVCRILLEKKKYSRQEI